MVGVVCRHDAAPSQFNGSALRSGDIRNRRHDGYRSRPDFLERPECQWILAFRGSHEREQKVEPHLNRTGINASAGDGALWMSYGRRWGRVIGWSIIAHATNSSRSENT